MKKDLISVIIPCYNSEKYLDQCIKSIENQTYKNFEVIFVDDGSKDNTLEILNSFCNDKKNFFVKTQKNSGPSAARNLGIANANGEFVYFMDSDDCISPFLFEILIEEIRNTDGVAFGFHWCRESFSYDKIKAKKKKIKTTHITGVDEIMSRLYSGRLGYTLWTKFFKMDILKKFENFPNVMNEKSFYGEDVEFNTDYFSHLQDNSTITKLDAKLYYYRMRKGSEVKSGFKERKLSIFNGLDKADKLDVEKYKNSKVYIKGKRAVAALEMLMKMNRNYENKETISKLYYDLKNNAKFLRKGKLNPWYIKYTIPLVVPFIRMKFSQSLKKR